MNNEKKTTRHQVVIESQKNKNALLVGNGVNLLGLNQSFSWRELLRALKTIFGINVDLDNAFKPFPLAFDEMNHAKSGENNFRSKQRILKQQIRAEIENQIQNVNGYNDYHRRLASLKYDDILTTNYDYSLQKSLRPDFVEKKNDYARNKQERKFSLKRSYKLPNTKTLFWHIHGEILDSRIYNNNNNNDRYYHEESIMIGYEHYSSYLQKIQENIKGKSGTQKPDNQSLMVRLKSNATDKRLFWTDIFFTHNIDIVGFGFDFSENHLWWLINYRANAMREQNPRHEIIINNKIRYYYPVIDNVFNLNINELNNLDIVIEKFNNLNKTKAIAEVLKAFHVEPIPIVCNSYIEFYNNLIDKHLKLNLQ